MINKNKDYYKILKIDKNSSLDDIKKKYRELAVKYHPDKNRGDKESEDIFKEISEAYSILSDPQKRNEYDLLYNQPKFNFSDFILNSLNKRYYQNNVYEEREYLSLKLEINITLKEGYKGCKKKISFLRKVICKKCSGSRCDSGSYIEKCKECDGRGFFIINIGGFSKMKSQCPCCNGRGSFPKKECEDCKGFGFKEEKSVLDIDIPEKIINNQILVYPEKGNQSLDNSGKFGYLIIKIKIKQNETLFLNDNGDIVLNMPIPIYMAIVGGEIEVPSLNGRIKVSIPKNIKDKEIIKIKNMGYRDEKDLIIIIRHEMPCEALSKEEEDKIIKGLAGKKYIEYNSVLNKSNVDGWL